MQKSEQINELATALAKAQAVMPSVPKTKTAKIKMKSGGEYGYSYADLADVWAACRAPLSDNGLSIVQTPGFEGHDLTLETMLLHSSGQWMASQIRWPGNQATMQELGGAITYLRRYAMAMIGIVTDADDDAQSAPARRDDRQPERNTPLPPPQRQPEKRAPAASPVRTQEPASDEPDFVQAAHAYFNHYEGVVGGRTWKDAARFLVSAAAMPKTLLGWRQVTEATEAKIVARVARENGTQMDEWNEIEDTERQMTQRAA